MPVCTRCAGVEKRICQLSELTGFGLLGLARGIIAVDGGVENGLIRRATRADGIDFLDIVEAAGEVRAG